MGTIRIIAGQWRGRRLAVPDVAGLRPSGDRVRETLFNWLQFDLAGTRCLDLFAGTGALGLEAVSRGAASAVLVERDRKLLVALEQIVANWPGGERVKAVQADALIWLEQHRGRFDVVFVDPPFSTGLEVPVLSSLVDGDHLERGARVYVEQAVTDPEVEVGKHFELLRSKVLGEVRMVLLGKI